MHHRYTWLILAFALGSVFFIRTSAAEDPQNKDKDKEKAKLPDGDALKPSTVKVEKGPFTFAVVLKGIILSEEATEFSVRPKTWTGQLVIRKAVDHGSTVKAGDILVEFETEKLDREIRDAKQERDLAQLAIRLAEQELPILEKQGPIDLANAERDFKEATEDMKRFIEIDRKVFIQSAEFMVKSANFSAEYAKDELKQLQKMYRDKDLTEETEQMILKRYKFSVESADLHALLAKIESEFTLKIELPRREQALKAAVEKAEIALSKAREVQPLMLQQKRLTLAHLRYEEVKAKEHLAELELDRAALTVKAPADGLAYHGRFINGQLTSPGGSQGSAPLGNSPITPGDVFLTVVSTSKLTIRTEVEEKELSGLKPGLAGRFTPTAFPDKKLPCELIRVTPAPREGKFDVRIKMNGKTENLVPGMTGSVRLVIAQKKSALTVPSSAVFEDTAEDIFYVYVPTKDGKHEKKTVKVGITSGDRTEILEGLAAGDEILESKP